MQTVLLVATDGSPGAAGALKVAAALAARGDHCVHVLGVAEPIPMDGLGISFAVVPHDPGLATSLADGMHRSVVEQVEGVVGSERAWPVEVDVGVPAPTIVRHATEIGADLIILGLGRHDSADRWLGSETALRVIHLADVPVLAVPADAERVPQRAVAALDFSEFSRDAAAVVPSVLAPEAELHLVHVAWNPPPVTDLNLERAWVETYRKGALQRLDEMAAALSAGGRLRTVPQLLGGEPAAALTHYVAEVEADLIAVGTHGYGFFARMVMGSVSTRIVRCAKCSVLVVPPRGVPRPPASEPSTASATAR